MTEQELIQEVAGYTGKKHAEEWYQAVFRPTVLESRVEQYVEHVNVPELSQLIQETVWKKSEAQKIFENLSQVLAKGMGISEENYPKIVLHEADDMQGSHSMSFELNQKMTKFEECSLHFDIDAMMQNTPAAHMIIAKIAHELVHIKQTEEMLAWLRWRPYLRRDSMNVGILQIIFKLERAKKPLQLLQWLNSQLYVPLRPTQGEGSDDAYQRQLKEAEAFAVEEWFFRSLEIFWHIIYGERPPALT